MSTAIRTYRGRAIEQLTTRMREDLGAEAVVVRRSEGRTRGVLGLFQRRYVEIEAMSQPEEPPQGRDDYQPRVRVSARARAPDAHAQPGEQSAYVTAYLASLAKLGTQSAMPEAIAAQPSAPIAAGAPPPAPTALEQPRPPAPAAPSAVPREALAIPAAGPPQAPPPAPIAAAAPAGTAAAPAAAPSEAAVRSFARARAGVEKPLLRRGLSAGFVSGLTETAAAHVLPLAPRAGLAQAVREALAQLIPVASPLPAGGGSIAFVGAGGSGKTAACASLLGAYRAASTLPARYGAVLSPDAGSEELRLLMSPDLRQPVALSSPRALRAVRLARESAFVVFDTPAVSPADRRGVRDLARALAELEPTRVVIALPATLGAGAAEQLIAGLAPLNPSAIALTHADETDQIGVGIEAACRFALPPEFIIERSAVRGWRLSRLDPSAVVAKLLD